MCRPALLPDSQPHLSDLLLDNLPGCVCACARVCACFGGCVVGRGNGKRLVTLKDQQGKLFFRGVKC